MIAVSALLLMAGLVPAPAQDISLEELLRRAREAQVQAQGPILEEVQLAIEQLSKPGLRENVIKNIAYNLAKLGPAAGPLLVPALNPGDALPAPYQDRSSRVLLVLQSFEDLGTTLALLEAVHGKSPAHARAALKALRSSTHRQVVAEALLPIISKGTNNPLSIPALSTLSNLNGPEATLWLQDCAERQDGPGEAGALQALAAARNETVGQSVLQTLKRKGRTSLDEYSVLVQALRYFANVPSLLARDDSFRRPLMELAKGVRAAAKEGQSEETLLSGRRLLLNTLLGVPELKLSADIRKDLRGWTNTYGGDTVFILAVLAKGGDSKSKREYLATHNLRVKSQRKTGGRDFASALLKRGLALQTISDYRAALRDAEKGLKEYTTMHGGGGNNPAVKKLRILAARASAAEGRFRSASEYLEQAVLSSKEAAIWAKAPEFREFMASRYSDVLKP